MKKFLLIIALAAVSVFTLKAVSDEPTDEKDTAAISTEFEDLLRILDSVQHLKYQTGEIKLGDGLATINVPQGFKYLDPEQTLFVLHKLWGNPPSEYLGIILPENTNLMDTTSWVFTIQYDPIGYVSDKDANDVDYNDLLKTMKEESAEENKTRKEMGYTAMNLVGWASTPYYDENKKILHWAKEFSVEEESTNTLNYNIRILGRKGVLVLNAIAAMPQLEEVKKNIDPITASIIFEQGNKYSDFNPDVDEVAAWTIGGLVAGKVLAKAGLFAVIAKFGKVIVLGLLAAGGALFKVFGGKKKQEDTTPSA